MIKKSIERTWAGRCHCYNFKHKLAKKRVLAHQTKVAMTFKWIIRVLLYFWVAPNTLLGILLGMLGLITGGSVQIRRSCIEFYGGWVTKFLRMIPLKGALAMTLGHSILGISQEALDSCRDHEQVHVKQYERWGVLFIPAYFAAAAYLWIRGKDGYRDNPFEVEAYSKTDLNL